MPFEFMQEPKWLDLDQKTKDAYIGIAFSEDIESDPKWPDVPKKRQEAVRSFYFDEAKTADGNVTPEKTGRSPWEKVKLGGRGLLEGATTEFPRMIGEAYQFVGDFGGYGKELADWADEKAVEWYGDKPQDLTFIDNAIYEGSKMLAPSLIPGGSINLGGRILLGVDRKSVV